MYPNPSLVKKVLNILFLLIMVCVAARIILWAIAPYEGLILGVLIAMTVVGWIWKKIRLR